LISYIHLIVLTVCLCLTQPEKNNGELGRHSKETKEKIWKEKSIKKDQAHSEKNEEKKTYHK